MDGIGSGIGAHASWDGQLLSFTFAHADGWEMTMRWDLHMACWIDRAWQGMLDPGHTMASGMLPECRRITQRRLIIARRLAAPYPGLVVEEHDGSRLPCRSWSAIILADADGQPVCMSWKDGTGHASATMSLGQCTRLRMVLARAIGMPEPHGNFTREN